MNKATAQISINGRVYNPGDVVVLHDKAIELDLIASGLLVSDEKPKESHKK